MGAAVPVIGLGLQVFGMLSGGQQQQQQKQESAPALPAPPVAVDNTAQLQEQEASKLRSLKRRQNATQSMFDPLASSSNDIKLG